MANVRDERWLTATLAADVVRYSGIETDEGLASSTDYERWVTAAG